MKPVSETTSMAISAAFSDANCAITRVDNFTVNVALQTASFDGTVDPTYHFNPSVPNVPSLTANLSYSVSQGPGAGGPLGESASSAISAQMYFQNDQPINICGASKNNAAGASGSLAVTGCAPSASRLPIQLFITSDFSYTVDVYTILTLNAVVFSVDRLEVIVHSVYTLTAPGAAVIPPDPNQPNQPTDHRFVATSGSGLKTGCSNGPLQITVPVNRVVGDVDGMGNLTNVQAMLDNHVISKTAKLRIASFGMNSNPMPPFPRADKIQINGNSTPGGQFGSAITITGDNNAWQVTSFDIQIQAFLFGTRNPGGVPTPGQNLIEVDVDTNQAGWCTVVDWVEISFDAIAPVIMVHGNGQGDDGNGGRFWDGSVLGGQDKKTGVWERLQMPFNVTDSFKAAAIPYDNSISMPSDTIDKHGTLLAQLVPAKAAEFGARHVHLICHSKGGLDLRDFLTAAKLPPNLGVLSMTTFDTPHHGSIGPSYQLAAKNASALVSDSTTHTTIAQNLDINGGTHDISLEFVEEVFNLTHTPDTLPTQLTVDGETTPVGYFSFSADANLGNKMDSSGNPNITIDDLVGFPGQGSTPNFLWAGVLQQVYEISGNVASVSTYWTQSLTSIGEQQVLAVKELPNWTFQLNDFCVTLREASIEPFKELASLKANHSTICGPEAAGIAIQNILAIQPIQ